MTFQLYFQFIMSSVGENQLQRIIRDLHDAVSELSREHSETGEPITDDSANLHKFCYKLEYLLQFDQKEKTTFLGSRKDYWDYFCDCLAKTKGANDGIRFVKSIPEVIRRFGSNHRGRARFFHQPAFLFCVSRFVSVVYLLSIRPCLSLLLSGGFEAGNDSDALPQLKTALGKGRAFIRYCLVHQRLADTLQQCLMNYKVTSDWFYERSPFLKSHQNGHIINQLYVLNEVQFDVASRGHDLDSEWPVFARKSLGSAGSTSHVWKPPSRCSSVNSLLCSYSQLTQEETQFLQGQDFASSLLGDLEELGKISCQTSEDLRIELDQSELRQRELLEKIQVLTNESDFLRVVVKDLQRQLYKWQAKENSGEDQETSEVVRECTQYLSTATQDQEALKVQGISECHLEDEQNLAEASSMELLAKLDGAMSEKGQTTSYCESAWTIQELLIKLKEAEEERIEAKRQSKDQTRLSEQQAEELKWKEEKLKEMQDNLNTFNVSADQERSAMMQQADELKMDVSCLQGRLSLKEREAENLQTQMLDLQKAVEAQEVQMKKLKLKTQEELEQKAALEEQLTAKVAELSISTQKIRQLESSNQGLMVDNQKFQAQAKKLDDYKNQCTSLMEINTKLIQSVKSNDGKELEKEHHGEVREQISTATTRDNSKDTGECLRNDNGESIPRLVLAEAQLELNMKEVSRLQEDVLELRAQLLVSTEEKMKMQVLQEVTEDSREDLRAQTQQLKAQVEDLNRRHIDELLRCQEREDQLVKHKDQEAKLHRELQAESAAMKEELQLLKEQNTRLTVENGEAREALHRANTETAELGVQVCILTGKKEEAFLRCEELSVKLKKQEMEAQEEMEILSESVEALGRDKENLLQNLKEMKGLPEAMQNLQERLKQAEEEARGLEDNKQRELDILTAKLSEEAEHHQNKDQRLNEELDALRKKLDNELQSISGLSAKVLELESANVGASQMIEQKNSIISDSETVISQKEEEIVNLKSDLSRMGEELAQAQQACVDLGLNLSRSGKEKQAVELSMSAEIDDLCRTKKNLEEKLIDLIRDKDALWQKSDALEFQQKLRDDEQTNRDVSYCLSCHNHFSWVLHKHNCRVCRRSFCYYCLSNEVSSPQDGSKERCCKDCQARHLVVGRSHPQAALGSAAHLAGGVTSCPNLTITSGGQGTQDDTMFDIITEDEVNHVHNSDSLSSPSETSSETQHISDDSSSDMLIGSLQDAEIRLLKSGEMTLSVAFNEENLAQFGKESRDLFIKSSCFSVIVITVSHPGLIISWLFSSEPKSISFSVVYRENSDTPMEQAKVLIPLTRCNSHKETIQGQLKARNAGEYTLIFDNSFSRFLSKKVLYNLSTEAPQFCNGNE